MKTVIATALLALSFQVSAHDVAHADLSSVEFVKHSEMVSEAGETQEQFLVRVALAMRSVTAETGFEYCGRLGMSEDGFAIVLSTNESQIGCLVSNDMVDGYAPVALHIHSHPHARRVRLTENDMVFAKKGTRVGQTLPVHSHTFSDTDYNGSAGYLVTYKALMYQYGRGNVRVVQEF